jgi:N-acetylmuramoyl-L-alanine amidase
VIDERVEVFWEGCWVAGTLHGGHAKAGIVTITLDAREVDAPLYDVRFPQLLSPGLGGGYTLAEHMLALLVETEAGGESYKGQLAVAQSVRNRVFAEPGRWWGSTWVEVMAKPHQYSAIHALIESREIFDRIDRAETAPTMEKLDLARRVIQHREQMDPSLGATHYFAPALMDTPEWAQLDMGAEVTAEIGGHRFYNGVA